MIDLALRIISVQSFEKSTTSRLGSTSGLLFLNKNRAATNRTAAVKRGMRRVLRLTVKSKGFRVGRVLSFFGRPSSRLIKKATPAVSFFTGVSRVFVYPASDTLTYPSSKGAAHDL
ncbi:MAG: hypothetical protein PVI11_08245 [Candidatus Aminicenantes bacterium]|jgi:hypothetical protein